MTERFWSINEPAAIVSATKNVPRRCVICAWKGEIHRGVKCCPDCWEPFRAPDGPYLVLSVMIDDKNKFFEVFDHYIYKKKDFIRTSINTGILILRKR